MKEVNDHPHFASLQTAALLLSRLFARWTDFLVRLPVLSLTLPFAVLHSAAGAILHFCRIIHLMATCALRQKYIRRGSVGFTDCRLLIMRLLIVHYI